ncbi:hypothetical protein BDV59DRAFT_175177 [Aspergillus ambiguus]|uniref:uncharacterized protein n=1 Tax=Aspergillus ambiguus TaxID=176160 RepID=UPI003CCCB1D0
MNMIGFGSHLPREGFYIDPIFSIVRTIFHPVPTILLSVYAETVSGGLLSSFKNGLLLSALLSAALWINDFLTKWSRNNWVRDTTWAWGKEIVMVTGGSSGIGASIVNRLADDGVSVVVVDIAPLTYKIENKPVRFYNCDLSDEEEVRFICGRIKAEVGYPTVLVNNAGLSRGQMIVDGSYSDNLVTLKTNLLAPFLLIKEFLPSMIERNHGHIVNISSLSAYMPPAGLADYSASKAGMIALHEALGLELKYCHNSPKVRTSLAVLSFTDTPLFKGELNSSHFIAPLMHVDTVGDAIVDTIYSGYGRTIHLPGISKCFAGIRGAPEWVHRAFLGFSKSLKIDFKGRQRIDQITGRVYHV